jgi:hypothetical protein
MSYWDTSCLIKLYTPEPDSRIFRDFLDVGAACVTCDITPLEFWAAVRRKESEGVLAPGEARKLQSALETDLADGLIPVRGTVILSDLDRGLRPDGTSSYGLRVPPAPRPDGRILNDELGILNGPVFLRGSA